MELTITVDNYKLAIDGMVSDMLTFSEQEEE